MYRYLLVLLIPLAACTTPQERCVADSTKDRSELDRQIATTNNNIQRGYAVKTRAPITLGLNLCTGGSHLSFCAGTQTTSRETPVSVDVASERRKLADLKTRRIALLRQTNAKIAVCKAAHPG